MANKQIKQKQQQTDLWLHYKQANEQQPQLCVAIAVTPIQREREGERGACGNLA